MRSTERRPTPQRSATSACGRPPSLMWWSFRRVMMSITGGSPRRWTHQLPETLEVGRQVRTRQNFWIRGRQHFWIPQSAVERCCEGSRAACVPTHRGCASTRAICSARPRSRTCSRAPSAWNSRRAPPRISATTRSPSATGTSRHLAQTSSHEAERSPTRGFPSSSRTCAARRARRTSAPSFTTRQRPGVRSVLDCVLLRPLRAARRRLPLGRRARHERRPPVRRHPRAAGVRILS